MTQDLLGSELTPVEARLLAVYEELKSLCGEEMPPNAHANVRASAGNSCFRPSAIWRGSRGSPTRRGLTSR